MAVPGTYTAAGTAIAPGPGTAVGAAVDIGTLIAQYLGEKEAEEKESKRFGMQFGAQRSRDLLEIEKEKRKEERRRRFSEALAKYSRRGA